MRILGIDPALTCLGWGVIESNSPKINYVHSGLIKTKPSEKMWNRLAYISASIEGVISLYKPDMIAMEETFVNKNPTTSLKLGYVRGAIMAAIGKTGIDYFEYPPNKIKKSIVGVGHAEKEQVKHMVTTIISKIPAEINFDESDALAIAYTCLVNRGTR